MGNTKFTEQQIKALEATGKTIVSASAGSGKTTVMIEKMLRLILSGVAVNEILAVTYTKKAAAQMKEKLREKLIEAINDAETSPSQKTLLKKQLACVPSADVSTVHSFCSKLIKTYFYAAGVGNTFSIIAAEDADGKVLQGRALDEIFERAYETKDPDFFKLLSVYYRKKNDSQLRGIITSVYNTLRTKPDYIGYLERSQRYDESVFDAVCAELLHTLKRKLRYYGEQIREEQNYFAQWRALQGKLLDEKNLALIEQGKKPLKVGLKEKDSYKLATELSDILYELDRAEDLFALYAVEKPSFTTKEVETGKTEEYALHIRRLAYFAGEVKAFFDKKNRKLAAREEELSAFMGSGEIARALAKYILEFDREYEAQKRDRGVLDYNDLEHIALGLLRNREIADEIRGKYRYVFVDEYQDVNPVQEAILSAVMGEEVFLVGDIKQSIYAFRGSKSVFFANKQREYRADPTANALELNRNFRSSDAVLKAVNDQFSLAMTKKNCEVDYRNDSWMERGGLYEEGSGRVRLYFTGSSSERKKTKEDGEDLRGVYSVQENAGKKAPVDDTAAQAVVKIIRGELHGRYFDCKSGQYKKVEYSDIAVLSRTKGGRTSLITSALAEEGIPVTSESPVNICAFSEIKTLIDILRLVDNAEQDIPLCSGLLSPMGELTEDELTQIRLCYPAKSYSFFRDACRAYAAERTDGLAQKLLKFFAYLQGLRRHSHILSAGEILVKILSETKMEAKLLARVGGENCLKRIHRFLDETRGEEPLGVHAFLERLKMLDYTVNYNENGGENSVRVMTMHASKGLEFPIVIVDGLSRNFHAVDNDPVLVEEEFGLAPKAYNGEKMTMRGTVLRSLCEQRQLVSRAQDELNLYYVALTRAKYGLHMIFETKTPTPDIAYAASYADFTDFSVWEGYEDVLEETPFVEEKQALAVEADEALKKEILTALSWRYAHSGCENLPVKSSATALMKRLDEEREEEYYRVGELFPVVEEEEKTGVAEGLAYHAFLERCSFAFPTEKTALPAFVHTELERMKKEALLTEEEFSPLSEEKLCEILSLPVFGRLQGKTLYREQRFMAAIPACEVLAMQGVSPLQGECEDELLFQGALDLMAESASGVEIIDYKYSKKSGESLKKHYLPQLTLYKKAVSRILKIDESKVRCTVVNIFRGFEVDMD